MASRTRSYICSACSSGGFTQTGLQSHLRQSTDLRCTALYEQMMDLSLEESKDQSEDDKTLSGPQPFAGDMFGGPEDYLGNNFGQANGEEEEEEECVDLEADWEPERPGAHGASVAASGDFDQAHAEEHAGHELMPNRFQRQVESHITENSFVVCYSDKYPYRRAGAAVKQKQPSDVKYRADLDSSSNLWAPFSSQLDWEIAKWAKLRGAGSTAFSDLLAIEGVSDIYRIIYVHSS